MAGLEEQMKKLRETDRRIHLLQGYISDLKYRKLNTTHVAELVKRQRARKDFFDALDIPEKEYFEFYEKLKEAHESAHEPREELISCNLRLVIKIAKEMMRKRGPHDTTMFADMIQEGNMGLMTAVERFDPSR